MKNFQYNDLKSSTSKPKIVVTGGKHAGLVALVRDCWTASKITLAVKPEVCVPYEHCEFADAEGNPMIQPVIDMTGREIMEGTWIVYSVGGGKAPHGLEMGKVDKISPKGSLRVQRLLRDGEKVANMAHSWRKREFTSVTDANRTVALPVDEPLMMTWVLKEFEDLKNAL